MNRLDGKIALDHRRGARDRRCDRARFAAEGATVVVNDLDAKRPSTRRDAAVGGGASRPTSPTRTPVRAMFAEVARRHGRLDVLVNNAGIAGLESDPDARANASRAHARGRPQELAAGGPVKTHNDTTLEPPTPSGGA